MTCQSPRLAALRRSALAAGLSAALIAGAAGHPREQRASPRAIASIGSAPSPGFSAGTVLTVTNCDDGSPAPAGSLREAMSMAQGDAVIDLSQLADCDAIVLTEGALSANATSLQLAGPTAGVLSIDGGAADLVLDVHGNLEIADLSIVNGATTSGGGGCVLVFGDLTLTRSVVSGCAAGDSSTTRAYGGGVDVFGDLVMQDSTIRDSAATATDLALGGGAYVLGNASLTDSTIEANLAAANIAIGGGIEAGGGASLMRSDVVGNEANAVDGAALGGGIDASGTTIFVGGDGEIRGNRAYSMNGFAYGGGIDSLSGSTSVTLSGTRVTGNTAESGCAMCIVAGGGIANYGRVQITASTIDANRAIATGSAGVARGGGIASSMPGLEGRVMITNSTISGNTVETSGSGYGEGGGIAALASFTDSYSSTIAFNHASSFGGGIAVDQDGAWSSHLFSTIVANNEAASAFDLAGGNASAPLVVSGDHSVVMSAADTVTLPADTLTDDPKLFVLDDNGGPTPTHELAACSPAIDTGSNFSLTEDQRGPPFVREYGVGPDIGAFELQPNPEQIFHSNFEVRPSCDP